MGGFMRELPIDQHITYQLQHRKCGKVSCGTCRSGQGHGPYWYAYWREGARLRSGYVGKVSPNDIESAIKSVQQVATVTPLVVHERVEEAVLV